MKIADYIAIKQDKKLYQADTELVSNTDGVGVELEYENIVLLRNGNLYLTPYLESLDIPFHYWRAVEDGSLREGTEFIFEGAMVGANITAALSSMQVFLDKYRRNNKPVSITERCSVHVHLDVRDLNEDQLNNLIMIYILVERVLFQHINPLRLKNNYCRPLSDSSFKHTLHNMIKQKGSMHALCDVIRRDCDKYSALNVLPVTRFGSVEFRHHHGTSDMSKVKDWINVILALKVVSRDLSINNLLDIYDQKGAIVMLSTIFDRTILGDTVYLGNMDDINGLVGRGIHDIKEILQMDELINNNRSRPKSKARVNTLIQQFKEAKVAELLSDFTLGA